MELNRKKFEIEFANKPLSFEISRLAEQADASVIGRYGDTEVLVTVVMEKQDRPVNYFPLMVDYEEKFYAAGKILGSRFVRREGRPTDEAILSGRIIDRSIRPFFNHKIRRGVQVVVTVLAIDGKSDPDFISLLTTSVALSTSSIPWDGPVAGVKILIDNREKLIVNPDNNLNEPDFKLSGFISGTKDKINMIEIEAIEASEKQAGESFELAQKEIQKLIDWQESIIKEIGAEKKDIPLQEIDEKILPKLREFLSPKLEGIVYLKNRNEKYKATEDLKAEIKEFLLSQGLGEEAFGAAEYFLEEEIDALVHKNILENDRRPDDRKLNQVRDLYSEIGLIKRTHGSAVFIRGNTQALAVTTLGPPGAHQIIESIEFSGKKKFLLHYNFPSYSVGEMGSFRGPGRRDIGHGALAGKAIRNLIPNAIEFPYTIRVVSEILSSNGSSSMATVCATSLSLMDAGVPIKKSVAGIAMGLMSNSKGDYKILTDIQGPEDHYGDMDFKVAGTKDGITAIQMDVKIDGITNKIASETLERAKTARLHILKAMDKTISEPRPELSEYAPLILTLSIETDKIGEVIGPGGKTINKIIDDTGVESIDIEEDGSVFITGESQDGVKAALEAVKQIVKTYEVGEIVEGEIVRIMEFGAILKFSPNTDGMIHVSELKDGFVKNVEDVLKIGDKIKAKIIKIENGKIGLSLKGVQQ